MAQPERPDGSNATAAGWGLIAVGIVAAFIGMSSDSLHGFVIGLVIGNLAIGLGVLLLSLGYLVHAIWFLPGREIPLAPQQQGSEDLSNCAWCGRNMAPYRACSTATDEANRERSPRLADERCIAEFRARGLMQGDVGE